MLFPVGLSGRISFHPKITGLVRARMSLCSDVSIVRHFMEATTERGDRECGSGWSNETGLSEALRRNSVQQDGQQHLSKVFSAPVVVDHVNAHKNTFSAALAVEH